MNTLVRVVVGMTGVTLVWRWYCNECKGTALKKGNLRHVKTCSRHPREEA